VWIDQTKATGIISKRGNNGGTLAHRDIAIDFIVWLFPEKRYELVKMIGSRILK
ncbi:MAG: KilA-N domain-containing protein, partial [Paludibacteraceae bacterium]|nr:KilA-N domain-containing protein [Paludibacteraceae bacterium]